MTRSPAVCLAFLSSLALGLLVEDALAEDPASPTLRSERFDLSDLAALPAAKGTALWATSDAKALDDGQMGEPYGHQVGEGSEPERLLTFQEPPFPGHSVSVDVAMDVLRRVVPGYNTEPGWAVRASGSTLHVRATDAGIRKTADALAFVRAALAPRLPVTATLYAKDGAASGRTVAFGATSLVPRRWTPVFLQRSDRRFQIDYDVEVAQESFVHDPLVAALPEGAELFLRYDPGETVSVVEVWTAALDHLEPRSLDLAGIRDMPESNTMARVDQPRTALRRAFTALAVPAATGSTAEIAWDGPGGGRTLRLAFGAVAAPPPDREAGRQRLAVFRAAALTGRLEQDQRDSSLDEWIEGLKEAVGPSADDVTFETYAEGFVACEGPASALAAGRDSLTRGEARLLGATVEVRAVAVPEAALRDALESGKVVVGATLSAEQEASLVDAGVPVASARVPVVPRVPARVSVGTSETFLGGFDVEIAQASSGMNPIVFHRFAGLSGTVRYASEGEVASVQFVGALSWARHDASTIEVAFRPPIHFSVNNRQPAPPGDDSALRRLTLPLGGHGEARTQATASFSADAVRSGRPALLAVLSRGGGDGLPDTVLLLATVRR
jgi:hypothetical protein